MSTRERCNQLMNNLSEFQMELVLAYIQGLTAQDSIEEDKFCEKIYQDYLDDPDRGHFVSEEDVVKNLE